MSLESLLREATRHLEMEMTPGPEKRDLLDRIDKGLASECNKSGGEVTIVTNDVGECVAVTRTDEEGRILSVIWERCADGCQPHKPGGEIVHAQHDETGRWWHGPRSDIPPRFNETSHRFCHNEMPGATMCEVCGADLPPSEDSKNG